MLRKMREKIIHSNNKFSNEELNQMMEELEHRSKSDSFDPTNPGSRPNKPQMKVLNDLGKDHARWRILRWANQTGKTSTPAWELSRLITNTHPTWERPPEWGDGPLKAIIAGQDRKMMELEIWETKMMPHLDRDEWHIVRSGNSISYVTHRPTGNQIIFLSHSDGSDKARRHMQGYVVHYVWIDEMPISIKIWEELEKRIIAKNGYLIATFTPKVKNEAIKRVVDNHCSQNYCTLYKASMLDNPILKDRIPEILEQMAGYPESYRQAVIYGEWYTGDSAVYFWEDNMVCPVPEDYMSNWRHIEACDPAMESKMGHIVFAEEPNTGTWWMISSDYIKGLDSPKAYVEEALRRTATKAIKLRVSDVAPWYTSTAATEYGVSYQNPYKKTMRKDELIKGLQAILAEGKLKIAPECVDFINEISTCQWSETSPGRIVNGQSYHCLDAAQYGVDALPKWTGPSALHQDMHTAAKMKHRQMQDERVDRAKRIAAHGPNSIMRPRKQWGRRRR
jgi:phage terminase large subunit-like protein